MYKSQAEAVKDWLLAYRAEEAEIAKLKEERAMLKARMTSISAQELSDMPRPPSNPKDRMSEYMIRLEALETKIAWKSEYQEICRFTIQSISDRLRKKEAQDIIRLRYLEGKEWTEILMEVYKERPEFRGKQSAFRRKMFRQHESALREMAKNWVVARDGR